MHADTTKLQTVSNFASEKNLSRQHVYRLIKTQDINSVEIDGIIFVVKDSKSETFVRKRKRT